MLGKNGMLNAYGVTNEGVEKHAKEIALACQRGYRVIPNFYPLFGDGQSKAIQEAMMAIKFYYYYLGRFLWALELNLSCPNVEKIQENMGNALALVRAIAGSIPNFV